MSNEEGDVNLSSSESSQKPTISSTKSNVLSATFLLGVGFMSMLGGFAGALAMAKKSDPRAFNDGLLPISEEPQPSEPSRVGAKLKISSTAKVPLESGASLAVRALGWGSLYAVSAVSLLSFAIWKLVGAKDFQEFRFRVGSVLPAIPKGVVGYPSLPGLQLFALV
ncbi:unnamed protein product [Cyprideis torosa]|uniref:Transmembrane protein 242 n=1 Tax=Cyprideis torosa TaxID=163714 RepID=A0A7R8WV68_9CRUS|nr:unnamed protein product [Cyprideis torosa]CAG0911035.1 unnamed protein product [Cyprideis torosa]